MNRITYTGIPLVNRKDSVVFQKYTVLSLYSSVEKGSVTLKIPQCDISQVTAASDIATVFLWNKRESPPAWTQEAYRPPCSKSLWGGGGVPTLAGVYLPWPGGYLPWVGGTLAGGGGYPPWLGGIHLGRGVDIRTNWNYYLPPSNHNSQSAA